MTVQRNEVTNFATLVESAARTASHTTEWVENDHFRALAIAIDVSASADTPALTVTVQGKDHLGEAYDIVSSQTFDGTVEKDQLYVYPGAPATAEESNPAVLPRFWRLSCVHGDADSITYSIGYAHLP